jgi:hypothetical protein
MSDGDLDFEVHDGQGLQATFRNGADAMLWAHQLINRGGTYIRVIHAGAEAEDPAQLVSWRFDVGPEEMPVAVRESE